MRVCWSHQRLERRKFEKDNKQCPHDDNVCECAGSIDYGSGFSRIMYRTDPQNPLRRIIRLESDVERTWRVTVRRYGRIVERTFADARYGGKRESLAAAKIYRDALEVYLVACDADHRL